MIRASCALPALLAFLALHCLQCGSSDPVKPYAYYATEHFGIRYEESEFSLQEVERFGERKERLLAYVVDALEVSFDGFINAYLYYYAPSNRRAFVMDGEIHESRSYALSDDGHEIVHAVVHHTIGNTSYRFLEEGIAMDLELEFESYDAVERFVDYCGPSCNDRYDYDPITEQLRDNTFDGSYFSYAMAGAFVAHLHRNFGIAKVKALYRASLISNGYILDRKFTELFGMSISRMETTFWARYF